MRVIGSVIMAELAGLALVTAGVALIYEPAAFMVAGVALILWAQGRGGAT